jgi:ABC-type uncharacterized transport system auxiliary subunit
MNNQRKALLVAALAGALALAGCWNNDDDDTTPVASNGVEVPDSAGASNAAFVTFLLTMSGSDETSEPLLIKDTFTVPVDDTNDPQPLT